MDEHSAATIDLRDYLRILRRRRWAVIYTVVAVVALAMTYTLLRTPVFESVARLVVQPTGGLTDDTLVRQLVLGQQELETQREVVTSLSVAEGVVRRLGLDVSPTSLLQRVRADLVGDTQVLEIRATSPDPEQAAALAQGFAEEYLDFRRRDAMDRTVAAAASVEQRIQEVQDSLDEIDAQRALASDTELEALNQQRAALLTQLGQLQVQVATLSNPETVVAAGGQIIRPAAVPLAPSAPKPVRTAILALVLGGLLGIGLALLRDFMDDSLRSDEEIARVTGRPVLGHIPRWEDPEGGRRLATLIAPTSPAAEAYRTLRTNVRFLMVGRTFRSLLITSAASTEGKTTTAANLAVAAARAGGRVMLVGVDLRRPTVHRLFGLGDGPGLSDVLVGEVELVDVITDVNVPNLRLIPSGNVPPNPAELLGSAPMAQLMMELDQIADLVIFDGPPILAVADALELAPRVGGTMLVVDAGRSRRNAVRAAAERLTAVGGQLLGSVMNNVTPTDDEYYYYADYASSGEHAAPERPSVRTTS